MAAGTFPPNPSERDLIVRVLAGDARAFCSLLKPYEGVVFLTAQSLLHNDSDAELAAQDAICTAFRKLPAFCAEERFACWLLRIAVQEIRAWAQRHRFQPAGLAHDGAATGADDGSDGYRPRDLGSWNEIPCDALNDPQLRVALRSAITLLSPPCRDVLILRDVARLTLQEVASVLAISDSETRSCLHRARLHLRDALASFSRSSVRRAVRPASEGAS